MQQCNNLLHEDNWQLLQIFVDIYWYKNKFHIDSLDKKNIMRQSLFYIDEVFDQKSMNFHRDMICVMGYCERDHHFKRNASNL